MTDVNEMLESIRRASEIEAEVNRQMLDNHLDHGDRVIASIAALKAANVDEVRLAAVLEAATANPT